MAMVDTDLKNKINNDHDLQNDGFYMSYKDQTSTWQCGQKCIVSTLILLLIMSSFSLIGVAHLLRRVNQLQQSKDIASFTIIRMNATSSPIANPTFNPTLNPSSVLPSKPPNLPSNPPSNPPSNLPSNLPSNQYTPSNLSSNPPYDLASNSSSHVSRKSPSQIHFVGDYKVSVQNRSHDNWLLCDGSFYDPRDYTELFDVVGYLFGQKISQNEYVESGTAYTKLIRFALPNPNNRVVGINGDKYNTGNTHGKESITLNIGNIPPHTHIVKEGPKCLNGKDHYYFKSCGYSLNSLRHPGSGERTHVTDSTGDGKSFEVYQPTIYIGNLFIYAGRNVDIFINSK